MSQLSITLLGPPRTAADGKQIEIKRRKSVALLAFLAVTGQSHSRDALATLLWPAASQSRARAALRSAIWTLNKTAVGDWLLIEPETVSLRPLANAPRASASLEQALHVDVALFNDLLDGAQSHTHSATEPCAECLDALTQAVSLYQNDFMAGFTLPDAPDFDEWQFFQAHSMRQNLAQALERLIALHSAQGDFSKAIPYARRHVALDPLHEPAHRTLMQLYAQAGQQSAALRQYEICRQTLLSELDLEPSTETTALYQQIHSGAGAREAAISVQGDAVESVVAIDRQRPTAVNPHNLPPDSTPFIGRQQELSQLAALLDDQMTRLLTIVGPGGIGKTRLALAAAAEQVSRTNFKNGIYFVSLAPLADPGDIVPAIADAVGYPFQNDQRPPRQQLLDYLSQKTILLLLDNLEHLLIEHQSDGAALVADLLQHAPQLKVLATSRERLNLYGEQLYPLQGLVLAQKNIGDTSTDYAAAALFLQRVRLRLPNFEIAAADVPTLANICRLVEGMPLALELAASRIDLLSLPEIAAEIQENLDFLKTAVRNIPDRHRSMQAVFNASWQSLTAAEKDIFAQLAVFRGGFTHEAAKAITGAALTTLAGLVNKSLIRLSSSRKRYEIHELLRQYAAEQLAGADEPIRNHHAAFYCAFLHQRKGHLKGQRQQEALSEIGAESENAHAAWRWAVAQSQTAQLQQALDPLALIYQWRSRPLDGEAMCRLATEKLSAPLFNEKDELRTTAWTPELQKQARFLVRAFTWQGYFELTLAKYEIARRSLQQAQTILAHPDLREQNLRADRAFLLLRLSNYETINDFGGKGETLNEESLALYRAIEDSWGTALALDALSQTYMNQGHHEKAIKLHEECLAIRRCLEDPYGIARSYNILGLLNLHAGQIETSEKYLRQSLSLYRTLDDRAQISQPLAVLGINLLFGGKFEECIATYGECWAIHKELGLPQEPFMASQSITRAKIDLGLYEEAQKQSETDLAQYRTIKSVWKIAFTLHNLGRIDLVKGENNQAQQHLQESAAILQKMNERSLFPDVLFCLAYAFRALGDRQRALEFMRRALKMVIETPPLNPMRFELPGMALLLVDQGESEQAVELYAAALQSPYIANSRWFADIAGEPIAAVAATLPQHVAAAARERGGKRDLWLTANALQAELMETNAEE